MSMLRSAAIVAGFLLIPSSAAADEIPDDVAACTGGLGSACTLDGRPGTCEASKCSRVTYGGQRPETVEYDCVACVLEAPPRIGVPASAEAPPKAEPAKAVPADAKPTADTKAEPAKSGCAIDPGPLSLATIPLGVVLVALARRRR